MKYLSVCSGVEAATVAWHHMGWQAAGFSEIEKFPSEVLAHHYPTVTNFGDMTKYKEWNLNDPIGLLVGGTPCQSFSVAGLRKGLDDPRGNLALTYLGILDHFRPKWCVWENVPGVLSSGGGRDFGAFLGALVELGYGFAYRVLDAQNFGVAQRRRRVFVVGYLGDWRPAAEVLFESDCLRGDTKKGRKKGQSVAGGFVPSIASTIQTTCHDYSRADGFNMIATGAFGKEIADTVTAKFSKGAELLQQGAQNGGNCVLQPIHCADVFPTLLSSTAGVSRPGNENTEHETYVAFGWQNSASQSMSADVISPTLDKSKTPATMQSIAFEPGIAKREGGNSRFSEEQTPTLRANMGDNQVSVAYSIREDAIANNFSATPLEVTPALQALRPSVQSHHAQTFIAGDYAVRRLTPTECERLQGFPDNYTNIKENCPDGPRYKALGNSMAVPVMRWIGERINKVNSTL